jgi:hypothetical protein
MPTGFPDAADSVTARATSMERHASMTSERTGPPPAMQSARFVDFLLEGMV